METNKLTAVSLTVGLFWGGTMLLAGIMAPMGWMGSWVALWSDIYIGYSATIGGAILGFLWGFVDAAIIVFVAGLVYRGIARVLGADRRAPARTSGGSPRV